MPLFHRHHDDDDSVTAQAVTVSAPAPVPAAFAPSAPATTHTGGVSFAKSGSVNQLPLGGRISFAKGAGLAAAGNEYTVIIKWRDKDYDVWALVEYDDGHVESVSWFGTKGHERNFSPRTKDGAVVHASGDEAADDVGSSDEDEWPTEVLHIRLNSHVKCVVPVVYSAINSGTGSFHRYHVSTYIIEGICDEIPNYGTRVEIPAERASRKDTVYTMVPVVIHNGPNGAEVENIEEYSAEGTERRPTVRNGHVTMNNGPESGTKPRPEH